MHNPHNESILEIMDYNLTFVCLTDLLDSGCPGGFGTLALIAYGVIYHTEYPVEPL